MVAESRVIAKLLDAILIRRSIAHLMCCSAARRIFDLFQYLGLRSPFGIRTDHLST